MSNGKTGLTSKSSPPKSQRNTRETMANSIDGPDGTPPRIKRVQHDLHRGRPAYKKEFLSTYELDDHVKRHCYTLPRQSIRRTWNTRKNNK